jgi:MFS family permease
VWWLSFALHDMAFGLLSVFLPLYVLSIGGSLLDVGLLTSLSILASVPADLFWGRVSDRVRRYKPFIAFSFISLAVVLYAISFVRDMKLLIALYALAGVLHSAHESPKNALLAEAYPREAWGRGFAVQRLFADTGWMLGLVLGFFASQYNLGPPQTLMLCSGLHVAAFLCALVFVNDPALVIERKLLAIERSLERACTWLRVFERAFNGGRVEVGSAMSELRVLCLGMVLFLLAGSMFFTPLPVFLSQALGLSQSTIFVLYVLNTFGSLLGYLLIVRGSVDQIEGRAVRGSALCRSILAIALALAITTSSLDVIAMTIILVLMGFTYAVFFVCSLILSMELVPEGKSGLFAALVNLSSACGALLGPLVAEKAGFVSMFLICGLTFLATYVVLGRLKKD